MGISRACRILGISRSSMAYKSIKDDTVLYRQLLSLTESHPHDVFRKYYHRLRKQGVKVNHKRLHRIYKQAGLSLRRKSKKRKLTRVKEPLSVPEGFTHSWSMDFMNDILENGRKIRTFNIIDDYHREVLHIEADYFHQKQPCGLGSEAFGQPLWKAKKHKDGQWAGVYLSPYPDLEFGE